MLVLAIDTSTNAGSVALYSTQKGLVAEEFLNVKRNHSDTIMKAIDNLLTNSNTDIEEVGKIGVAIGPGSFTGVRVGVSIAKGFVFGKEKDIVGYNTLDLIANNVTYTDKYIMPLIDARKGRAYFSLYKYENGNVVRVEDYQDGTIEEFLVDYKEKEIIFVGDGSQNYKETIVDIMGEKAHVVSNVQAYPKASILAQLVLELKGDNEFTLEPYYHSKTQAEREYVENNKNKKIYNKIGKKKYKA